MNDPTCPLGSGYGCAEHDKIDRLEKDLAELRRQNSSSHERIFERLGEVEKTTAVQKEQYSHILERLDTIDKNVSSAGTKLDAIEAKPAKRWEDLVKTALTVLITGLVTYFLYKMGLKA